MRIRNRFLLNCTVPALLIAAACGPKPSSPPPRQADSAPPAGITDARPVIVAFGNSLTAGLGVDPSENYPAKLQQKLDASGYAYRVVNAGVSGDTSAQGLNRLAVVRELNPAVVILEFGANDGLRGVPVEASRANLDEMIGELRSDGVKVVLAGMEIPPNYGPAYSAAFRRIFPDLGKKHGIAVIPFILEGVGGIPSLNQDDGIHPTAQGYDIVVNNVWKFLKPLLD